MRNGIHDGIINLNLSTTVLTPAATVDCSGRDDGADGAWVLDRAGAAGSSLQVAGCVHGGGMSVPVRCVR